MKKIKRTLIIALAMILLFASGCNNMNQPPASNKLTESGKDAQGNAIIQTVKKLAEGQSYKQLYSLIYPRRSMLEKIYDDLVYGNVKYMYEVDMVVEESMDLASGSFETNGAADLITDEFSSTNLQEIGVDEADVIKTDGKYIYILSDSVDDSWNSNQKILIVKVEGSNLEIVSNIIPNRIEEYKGALDLSTCRIQEMYVDENRLMLVGSGTGNGEYSYWNFDSFVRTYDITDRSNPVFLNEYSQSGSYISSRKIKDKVYLVSEFSKSRYYYYDYYRKGDYPAWNDNLIDEYFPSCNEETIAPGDILCPDEITFNGFCVMGSVDSDTGNMVDAKSIVLNPKDMYVSENAIYFTGRTSEYANKREIDGKTIVDGMSILAKYTLNDGMIEYSGEMLIPGYTDNQFSFSEKDGFIRIATTSSRFEETALGSRNYINTATGIYVINDKMEIIGSVTDLAPGEQVKSSRFIGDMAYMVTFVRTDPLFAIDLSDPYNPVVLGELKIPGFSEYMHPYSSGEMLGIGYEADENTGRVSYVKLSMFDISNSCELKENAKLVLEGFHNAPVLYNHKALLIDPARNIFGFEASGYADYFDSYNNYQYRFFDKFLIFTYEDGQFKNLLTHTISDDGYYDGSTRALYIGNYLYIITPSQGISCYDMNSFTPAGNLSF